MLFIVSQVTRVVERFVYEADNKDDALLKHKIGGEICYERHDGAPSVPTVRVMREADKHVMGMVRAKGSDGE